MPLSPPAERAPLHERTVRCRGYRRADGLWDVEGTLTDTKTYDFDIARRGRLPAGEPVHDMALRLTLDDAFTIVAVEAVTEASPYAVCGAIAPDYARLVGLSIGPGFTRAVKERMSGTSGCTHLTELLGPVATTAFQTIAPVLQRERAARSSGGDVAPTRRPALLDSCHAFASDGEVAHRLWPAFYTGTARTGADGAPDGSEQAPTDDAAVDGAT